jgi:hypothetical protein
MSRLHRSLWHVEATFEGRIAIEPPYPIEYDMAAILAPMMGEDGAKRAVLRRVPGTRAPWEFRAAFEASDPPDWSHGG